MPHLERFLGGIRRCRGAAHPPLITLSSVKETHELNTDIAVEQGG